MEARFVQRGDSVDYTPPEGDVQAGQVVIEGELLGIAKLDIPAGTRGALAVSGVFDVAKLGDGPIARGQRVYFSPATRTASATVHGQVQVLGWAVAAADQNAPTVRVRIDGTTSVVVENS